MYGKYEITIKFKSVSLKLVLKQKEKTDMRRSTLLLQENEALKKRV